MKKKYINKTIGLLSLSSMVIISGCSVGVQGSVTENVAPITVEVTSVQEEILSTGSVFKGTVTPSKEVKVTSKVAGTIVGFPVKLGQKVKAGQVLAKIDDTDFRHAVEKAEAAVAVAEANVESAKAAHDSSVGQATSGTIQSKSGVSQSKGSMIQSKSGITNAENAIVQAKNTMIQAKNAIITAENGIITTENAMVQANETITKAQNTITKAKNNISDRNIESKKELQTLNDAKTNLNRMKDLYAESLASKVQIEQAETAVVNAQTTYDRGKVESNTLQNELKTAQTSLTTAKKAYANTKKAYTNAKKVYANAKTSYANAKKAYANAETGYANAESSYDNASEGYDTALEGYANAQEQQKIAENTSSITASEQALKQAQVNAQIAQDTLNDAVIKAPISGVISEKKTEKGELISSQAPLLVLANFTKINILTYVPTTKINEIKVGNSVQIKIAELNQIMTGKVHTISPLDEDGKGYPVKIEVSNTKLQLKEGMIADIHVIQADDKKGIIIPEKAIEHDGKQSFVYIAKGNQAKRQEIQTRQVAGSLIVTKGLVKGDKLIISNLILLSDAAKITYAQKDSK